MNKCDYRFEEAVGYDLAVVILILESYAYTEPFEGSCEDEVSKRSSGATEAGRLT